MFKAIRNGWKEARGNVLRKESEDSILRLRGLSPEVNARTAFTFAAGYEYFVDQHGPIDNISNEGKKKLSKLALFKAKETFEMDMGQGYGYALLSMYLESAGLPGDDAAFAYEITSEFLNSALEMSAEIDQSTSAEVAAEKNRTIVYDLAVE